MFIRFDMIHERGRQTDGRTDGKTPHDGIDRAYAYRAAKTGQKSVRAVSKFPQDSETAGRTSMKLGTYIPWYWGHNFYRKRNFEFRPLRGAGPTRT